MIKLIGFIGKAGHGKTTCADALVESHGATKVSLATAVKEEVAGFLHSMGVPFEDRHLYGSSADKDEIFTVTSYQWTQSDYRPRKVLTRHLVELGDTYNMSYRLLMQLWGTDYRRAQDSRYWENKAAMQIGNLEGLAVVDDVRFPNEVEMVRALGGEIIKVIRPGGPYTSQPDHPSETSLDDFKSWGWLLYNGGTVEDLQAEIVSVARYIL